MLLEAALLVVHLITKANILRETVVRQGFLSQHLLVNDFLPLIHPACIAQCVEVTGGFGHQRAELNISLTAVGLLVSIFYSWSLLNVRRSMTYSCKV